MSKTRNTRWTQCACSSDSPCGDDLPFFVDGYYYYYSHPYFRRDNPELCFFMNPYRPTRARQDDDRNVMLIPADESELVHHSHSDLSRSDSSTMSPPKDCPAYTDNVAPSTSTKNTRKRDRERDENTKIHSNYRHCHRPLPAPPILRAPRPPSTSHSFWCPPPKAPFKST